MKKIYVFGDLGRKSLYRDEKSFLYPGAFEKGYLVI